MKKNIICIILLLLSSWWLNHAYGITYKSDFTISVREDENTQANIDKAKLLEKYARGYEKEIKNLQDVYEIPNSPLLKESLGEVDTMIDVLRDIQTPFMEKSDAEEILSSIIKWLKQINDNLKPYLKKQQELYQQELIETKESYIKIGNKISSALYNFIEKLSVKLSTKQKLSSKEKAVVEALVKLNKSRKDIATFEKVRFTTKAEMKDYYINVIKDIRNQIKTIKDLLT